MNYGVSSKAIAKLCELEGYRQYAYKDSGGLWTIGYGQRCREFDFPGGISEADAAMFVVNRATQIANELDTFLPGLMPHQVDALILFIYNVGSEAFKASTVSRSLRAHSVGFGEEWQQYVHNAMRQIDVGLVKRRLFEATLFIYGWGC